MKTFFIFRVNLQQPRSQGSLRREPWERCWFCSWQRLWTEPRFRKYRSLDLISKRRTGFVKQGLIKRGFIKHELVKHGSMDKTCFINRCLTNPCFINPFFFYLINVLAIQVALVHVSDPYLIVCLEPAECAFNSISGLGYVLWFFVYLSLFCTKVMKHQTILYSCYCINNVV